MSDRYLSLYYGSLDAQRGFALLASWFSAPFVSRADREAELAAVVRQHLGGGEVFACGSARGALAAVLRAADVGPDDEVLISAFTCLAVPSAVLVVGARPVYLDIDPGSLNTTAAETISAFGPRTRAVVVQHTLGSIADVATVVSAAHARGILVIEDCALSVGSQREGQPVGRAADAAIFSMEMSKSLSTGWGGVLAVHTPALAARVAVQRAGLPRPSWLARQRDTWQTAITALCYERALFPVGRYLVAAAFRLGLFRVSTSNAEHAGQPGRTFIAPLGRTQLGLAIVQWRRLPEIVAASHANVAALRSALMTAGLTVPGSPASGDLQVAPRVPFLVADRATAMRWFAVHGVELGCWFDGPLSPLPTGGDFAYDPARYPRASAVARHIVNLPSHCGLDRSDRDRLAALVGEYAAAHPLDRDLRPAHAA